MRRIDQRGETLVEVVMALGILSLVLVSSYALATGTFRLGRGAGERTQAVNSLQQQAEALRSYRDDAVDWQTFVQGIGSYTGAAAQGPSFCMVKTQLAPPVSGMAWKPVDSGDAACKTDGVKITIWAAPAAPANGANGLAELYSFNFRADWNTGSQANNVSLTTKLGMQK